MVNPPLPLSHLKIKSLSSADVWIVKCPVAFDIKVSVPSWENPQSPPLPSWKLTLSSNLKSFDTLVLVALPSNVM